MLFPIVSLIGFFIFAGQAFAEDEQTPSADPSPMVYSNSIHISEFLPDPNGNDDELEFIELYNASSEPVDISGWVLKNGSTGEFIILSISIPENGYVAFYSSKTGSMLANTGQRFVRLFDPSGVLHEEAGYNGSKTGHSYVRTDIGLYEETDTPTPNTPNSSMVSPSPTTSPTESPSVSPSVPPCFGEIVISEFLPNPSGDDASQEYIELYNPSPQNIDLSLWKLDDSESSGSSPFVIPESTAIASGEYLAFFRTQTKISLNNDSDHVRIICGDGTVLQDISYDDVHDGYSYNRIDQEHFDQSSTPTPGAANVITKPSPSPRPDPTAKPAGTQENNTNSYDFSSDIFINELLPDPVGLDTENEFIEIKSKDKRIIHLQGWRLDDAEGGSAPYRFRDSDSIAPGRIMLFSRLKTKISLNNTIDTVRLIDPKGGIVSSISYGPDVPEGRSYNRTPEGIFLWSVVQTPGKENIIRVQEEVSPVPSAQSVKRVTPKNTPRVSRSSSARTHTRTPAVLSAVATSILPWPESLLEEGVVSRSVISSREDALGSRKKLVFVFFGLSAAFMQGLSGISHRERIWQK